MDTPLEEIRQLLVAEGIRQNKDNEVSNAQCGNLISQKFVTEEVNKTLKKAQSDSTIMKGLIQYLNWQDRQTDRISTP